MDILQPVDPNERLRVRRRRARRRRRIRRAVAALVLLGLLAGGALGATVLTGGDGTEESKAAAPSAADSVNAKPKQRPKASPKPKPRELPYEIRGVHVTMALASIPGKLESYMSLRGLNTIELDVKDENGEVAWPATPLARQVGSAMTYYKPQQAVAMARRHGIYLIGRVVVFEDPILSRKRPDMAIRTRSGGVWQNHAGLGWSNPYDKRVWDYNVDLGIAAAKAGFDEIQFDYIRFPSDGNIDDAVYRGKVDEPAAWTIARFAHYASKRLKPLGVRVSADVFGLSAARDLGIGQRPGRLAKYFDAIYPMVYPSHYGPGEYNIPDPNAAPRETVRQSLIDFRRQMRGTNAKIIPWLQDFSWAGRTYGLAEVQAQIDAAREIGAAGFLLWNAAGVYTEDALAYDPS